MVWTHSGPYIYFDEANGSPSPGFRLGFPTIQEKFFNARVGQNAYVLITPDGGHTEMRQVGTSSTYEAADSSYLQLIDSGSSLLVRATDGTQLSYTYLNNEWRCGQIKDRNGNYITVTYDWRGQITSVKDTLERVLTFNYDSNSNLLSITQTWTVNGQPLNHPWATFGWGSVTMQSGFSGAATVGAPNNTVIPVVNQVGLADGSRYNFDYNAKGQVTYVHRYTSDNIQRTYTAYDYESPASDCPRISATRVYAVNWTGINGVPSEVMTQYSEPGDGSHQIVSPDGAVYKEFYGTGWQKGLTTATEIWSSSVKKKWTTTAWTQDNTGVSYQTNPRPTETNIYDADGNRRRSTVSYASFTLPSGVSCNLPGDVSEYNADATTLYRRNHTGYLTSSAYLNQHIIGLVETTILYDDANGKLSEKHYSYDTAGHLENMPGSVNPVQHDASYNTGFSTRGNLTIVTGNSVDSNPPPGIDIKYGYNVAGSMTFTRDMLWHQVFLSYGDSFSDLNNSRNTFAYPTTVSDNDWNATYLRYNFDFGAKTRHKGPPAQGQTQGAIKTMTYDDIGRLERTTMTDSGAYTRYVYGPYYVQSYSTVNNVADDAYSIQTFDGVGHPLGMANNNPGSSGGYKAQIMVYDLMGQSIKQSNPAEITSAWVPTGDDVAGWLYTQQTYDWKGRPLVTINTDDTQAIPSRKQISYAGCGCAGGEVVTLTDEVGRRQKVYSDVFGRTAKTEVLNADGTVYSAKVNTYNQLDQITRVRQYAGAEGSSSYQDTEITYDGYGRLWKKHTPKQDTGTHTTWEYNTDNTVHKVIDARGASATYSYNTRQLLGGITYTPSEGVAATPEVSFAYDAAGNRTSMTDATGTTTYQYNQLSQMQSETHQFSGFSKGLSYQYNLAGAVKKITDSTNVTTNYDYDATGRVTAVTGENTLINGVSSYASNIGYRAWGSAKQMTYGNGAQLNLSYNERLGMTRYELSNVLPTGSNQPTSMGSDNQYYVDGRIRYAGDLQNSNFDRGYTYDHTARLKEAYSGREARGEAPLSTPDNPLRQSYSYTAWNDMSRTGKHWSAIVSDTPTYSNHRRADWTYDAEGNETFRPLWKTHSYDAAGREIEFYEEENGAQTHYNTIQQFYDGDGQIGKRVETRVTDTEAGQTSQVTTTYYLRSSVLGGQIIAEFDQAGSRKAGSVYLHGMKIADQTSSVVTWRSVNPVTGNWLTTNASRSVTRTEMDPLGADVGTSNPYSWYNEPSYSEMLGSDALYFERANPFDFGGGCILDGMPVPCSELRDHMEAGAVTNGFRGVRTSQNIGTPENPSKTKPVPNLQPIKSHGLGLFEFLLEPEFEDASGRHVIGAFNPQSSQTKIAACTFNINISGISGQDLIDAQTEIGRIFRSGGVSLDVTFNGGINNNPASNSTNLFVVQAFTGEAAKAIVAQHGSVSNSRILGVTPLLNSNNSYVNQANIRAAATGLKGPGASIGTRVGRVAAHELIEHRLLGNPYEGTLSDITASRLSREDLYAPSSTRFELNLLAAESLLKRCR
jgi:YD repeat-containing protein